jgi:hypothetical protein
MKWKAKNRLILGGKLYKKNMSTQNSDRDSTIIQNITLGYHFVSDIKLQWGPKEVKDLTWEDPIMIKKSKDLKDSLRSGILKQLNDEEYEKTMQIQYQRERKQLLKDQQNKVKLENVEIEGLEKEFLADTFDVSEARKKSSSELDITGTANHPMSYVTAFEIAQAQANDKGDTLTAEEFSIAVERNPKIVPALLKMTKAAQTNPNKAVYVATPPNSQGSESGVVKTQMRNLNQEMIGEPNNTDVEYIMQKLDVDADVDFAESMEVSSDEIIIDIED